MNCDKELNLTSSKSKAQRWRLGLIWGLIFAIGITNSGCKKDDNTNNDTYYVKYQVNSSSIYIGGTLNVEITGANNQISTFIIKTRSPWETTIGPVNKGFTANLSVSEIETNFGHLTLQAQILVSKNSSAFALQQSDDSNSPRTSVQINYTINY